MGARQKILVIIGGFFLLVLDQVLKWQALHVWREPHLFGGNWFGWQLFLNPGVAFSLPVPSAIIPVITVLILMVLAYFAIARVQKFMLMQFFAGTLLAAGAVSNLMDRVASGATVDYIRILTGVFNLADFYIVIGALLLFVNIRTVKALAK
jgi:lipoprotein signal peptidase